MRKRGFICPTAITFGIRQAEGGVRSAYFKICFSASNSKGCDTPSFAPLDSVKVDGISEKDMDILIYHISLDRYTSNKQIREWLEVDKDTAAKVIYALRKAGYIGNEYSNYMIPVNITTEAYFRLKANNDPKK